MRVGHGTFKNGLWLVEAEFEKEAKIPLCTVCFYFRTKILESSIILVDIQLTGIVTLSEV